VEQKDTNSKDDGGKKAEVSKADELKEHSIAGSNMLVIKETLPPKSALVVKANIGTMDIVNQDNIDVTPHRKEVGINNKAYIEHISNTSVAQDCSFTTALEVEDKELLKPKYHESKIFCRSHCNIGRSRWCCICCGGSSCTIPGR
jgi:hypothetical protein